MVGGFIDSLGRMVKGISVLSLMACSSPRMVRKGKSHLV